MEFDAKKNQNRNKNQQIPYEPEPVRHGQPSNPDDDQQIKPGSWKRNDTEEDEDDENKNRMSQEDPQDQRI